MVLDGADASLFAQQALRGLDVGDTSPETHASAPSSEGKSAAPCGKPHSRSHHGCYRTTAGTKLYAFCGMTPTVAKCAARCCASLGVGLRDVVGAETEGLLGRGVYCSANLRTAKGVGAEVVLVRIVPDGAFEDQVQERFAGIKVVLEPDPVGHWREEGYAGCWLPPGLGPVMDVRGELCVRAEAIVKATPYPQSALSADQSADVRKSVWALACDIPGARQRFLFRARLVHWPSIGIAAAAFLVSLFMARLHFWGSACGAVAIAAMFCIAST